MKNQILTKFLFTFKGHRWPNDEYSFLKKSTPRAPHTNRSNNNTNNNNVQIENDNSVITSFRKNVSFKNNNNSNRSVNLNDFLNVMSTRSAGAKMVGGGSAPPMTLTNNSSSNRFGFTNEELTLMCPVTLHHRIAFERHDIECRCRKQNVPYIHDVEFDYMLKLVPVNQMIIVVIVDSR